MEKDIGGLMETVSRVEETANRIEVSLTETKRKLDFEVAYINNRLTEIGVFRLEKRIGN